MTTLKFFHRIISTQRRSNTIITISVNRAQVKRVEGVHGAVFNHFATHFQSVTSDRLGI